MGKGPYAPAANGLVKIGEIMTLVITVTGDPGFDIQVFTIKNSLFLPIYNIKQ